ncbi:MAG TPA: MBL fold metallo-hydrolase [Puia sp.]|nr:MBL fold metallo-hydrolase [Puia sp.]
MALLSAFGKNPSGDRFRKILHSSNYRDGAFQNPVPTEVTLKGVSIFKMLREYRNKPKDTKPPGPVPSVRSDLFSLPSEGAFIVWFGHSSYLLKINGVHILVDPVFSGNASPVSFFGKSFPGSDVYGIKDLPDPDLLILTHDHYDHLDYKTVKAISGRTRHIYTSLGVGSHLEYWGINPEKITELDWWETADITQSVHRTTGLADHGQASAASKSATGAVLTATPARHFSGRLFRRGQTLWSSFVLKMAGYSIFLGGDSGYGPHFKTIGDRFGPFDIAILECGQYGKNWPYIHMMPEQTVTAAEDLGAKALLPVHWGKFVLALHPWDEPVRRVTSAAADKGLPLATPMIGQPVRIGGDYPRAAWWE